MEAWNVYLAVCIDHMPSRAPSLVAYQRIITSANTLHPLESWLHYDVQFRTLAASNPTLRWDTHHPDLWLQCITPASAQRTKRWPCPHCGAVTHFHDRFPFRPYSSKQTPNRQWNPSRGQSDSQYTGNPIINKNPMPPNQTWDTVRISTTLHATDNIASSHIVAKPVAPTTQLEFAPKWQPLELPTKPQPWTPIRSFLLERELSSYPDKVFVRQLIHDLQFGCNIGYTGPQFAHLTNNLPSAHQQPKAIDATLKKECEAGRILGPFQTPPLKNFRTSGLGVIPKHDGGWHIIYHLSALMAVVLMISLIPLHTL